MSSVGNNNYCSCLANYVYVSFQSFILIGQFLKWVRHMPTSSQGSSWHSKWLHREVPGKQQITEGLPGVLGNKGTWPISTGEQGNKGKISKGAREQKTF